MLAGLLPLAIGTLGAAPARAQNGASADAPVSPALQARVAAEPAALLDVIVWLRDQPARRIAHEARQAQAEWRRLLRQGVEGALQLGDEASHRAWRQLQKSLRRDTIHHTLREARRLTRPEQRRVADVIRALGGTPRRGFTSINAIAATLPATAVAILAQDPGVARIGEDAHLFAQLGVSAPAIGAPTFWTAGFAGGTADVAVFDSGVDRNHPAFVGLNIVDHVSLATVGPLCGGDNVGSADDFLGHGTLVAGVITSRDATFRGVAPGIERLYNVKILCRTIEGLDAASFSDAVDAADWLLGQPDPPEAVNASLGVPASGDDSDLARFVDAFMEVFDTSITIAVGNIEPGNAQVQDPGIAWNVLTVMNMDDRGTVSRTDDLADPSSSQGPTLLGRRKPDLGAPGTNITTTGKDWESGAPLATATGTSLAAPHVAGAAALLAHAGVDSALERKVLLINTAEDRGSAGWDATHGWGYVDLVAAFAARTRTFSGELTAAGTPTDHRFYRGSMPTGGRATLTWNRHITEPDGLPAFNDLNLELYDEAANSPIAASTSTIDNVEQIRWGGSAAQKILKVYTVTTPLAPSNLASEPYALAVPADDWVEVAPPALTITGPNGIALVDQVYELVVTVQNTGGLRAYGVEVTLTLPANVSLFAGANPASIAALDAGAQTQIIWMVRPTSTAGSPVTLDLRAQTTSFAETFTGGGSVQLTLANPATLTVVVGGTNGGTGSVTGTGIACGLDCSETVAAGTVATLTASPAAGSTLTGWTNCDAVSLDGLTCTVSVTAPSRTVTATFVQIVFTLAVVVRGSAAGSVASDDAAIGCLGTCVAAYSSGIVVTLRATPGTGSTFKRWSGACSGTDLVCVVTVDQARSVTATFTKTFTDTTVTAGVTRIRAVHVTELRQAIDALRAQSGLPAFAWTDATLTVGTTIVRSIHFSELRSALDAVYVAAGLPPVAFTDGVLAVREIRVRAVHLREVRAALDAVE